MSPHGRTIVLMDGVDVRALSMHNDDGKCVVMESERHLLGDRTMRVVVPGGRGVEMKVHGALVYNDSLVIWEHAYTFLSEPTQMSVDSPDASV